MPSTASARCAWRLCFALGDRRGGWRELADRPAPVLAAGDSGHRRDRHSCGGVRAAWAASWRHAFLGGSRADAAPGQPLAGALRTPDGEQELALLDGKGWGRRPVEVTIDDPGAVESGLLLFAAFVVRGLAEDAGSAAAASGGATSSGG